MIQRILRRELMRESSVYQEFREEIIAAERLNMAAERLNGERSLVLRLLNRRVGALPETVQAQVEALPLERMETLALDLLDFTGLADLENWLA
jgi:predicted transposase YdaD